MAKLSAPGGLLVRATSEVVSAFSRAPKADSKAVSQPSFMLIFCQIRALLSKPAFLSQLDSAASLLPLRMVC